MQNSVSLLSACSVKSRQEAPETSARVSSPAASLPSETAFALVPPAINPSHLRTRQKSASSALTFNSLCLHTTSAARGHFWPEICSQANAKLGLSGSSVCSCHIQSETQPRTASPLPDQNTQTSPLQNATASWFPPGFTGQLSFPKG